MAHHRLSLRIALASIAFVAACGRSHRVDEARPDSGRLDAARADSGPRTDSGPVVTFPDAGGDGSTSPDDPEPTPCRGRSYCDCVGGCEPLIDLSTGCVCECDEPFNCTGEMCACVCGGATYLGCAAVGECPEPRVSCADPGSRAMLVDGCPTCPGG